MRKPGASIVVVALSLAWAAAVHAACDTIPSAIWSFRSARGSVDRPYAAPGQLLQVRLDRAGCDRGNPEFRGQAADHVVTFMFKPTGGVPQAVVLATDCRAVPPDACQAEAPGVVVHCVPLNGQVGGQPEPRGVIVDDRMPGKRRLQVRFPSTDAFVGEVNDLHTLTGPVAIAVTGVEAPLPCALASKRCADVVGPATIACIDELFARDGSCGTGPGEVDPTFASFTALPPANDYQAVCTAPLAACRGGASEVRFAVDKAGNALLPVDWRGVLLGETTAPLPRLLSGSTTMDARSLIPGPVRIPGRAYLGSFTSAGVPLPPLFEPQFSTAGALTLVGTADAPETVLRLARRRMVRACVGGDRAGRPCTGEPECPAGVCAGAHRYFQCVGGDDTGSPCASDDDCRSSGTCDAVTVCAAGRTRCGTDADCAPGEECGPNLFEFRDRTSHGGIGPVVIPRDAVGDGLCQVPIEEVAAEEDPTCSELVPCAQGPCVEYRAEAQEPYPIEGLTGTPDIFLFAVPEAIEARDLNGDGDATDDLVLTVRDHQTGVRMPIGESGAEGRAVARVLDGVLHFPAVASEDDVIAFLEPEPLQGSCGLAPTLCDRNGDGDLADTMLRVFRKSGTTMVNVLGDAQTAVDAAPLVNGRSLVVSDGRIFVRRSEASGARHVVTRVSVDSDGAEANGDSVGGLAGHVTAPNIREPGAELFVSKTGRFVLFQSIASNLVDDDTNLFCDHDGDQVLDSCRDVFLHDRDPDRDGIYDETGPGKRLTIRADVAYDGAQADADAAGVFRYATPSMSCTPDGRYVVFSSYATNLVPDLETERDVDLFVHDRDADADGIFDEPDGIDTERISVRADGEELEGHGGGLGVISADGRHVVFDSYAKQLVPDDGDDKTDLFARDRDPNGDGAFSEPGETARVGAAVEVSTMSANGRFVGFASWDPTLVPDDTNGGDPSSGDILERQLGTDSFVLDRDPDEDGDFSGPASIVRVNVSSTGRQTTSDFFTTAPAISDDGRLATFGTIGSELVPGDTNGFYDLFLHDRDADGNGVFDEPDGIATRRITSTVTSPGATEPAATLSNDLSADGRYTAIQSGARLTLDDTPDSGDAFVHDNLTGLLARVTPLRSGSRNMSVVVSISDDGNHVVFATDEVFPARPGHSADTAGHYDVFVWSPDPTDASNDLTGDGALDDTVLEVIDVPASGPAQRTALCPATQVAVANGAAAFLRPEAAGIATGCPWDASSLNGDEDLDDDVVHVWTGGTVQNLHCAASAVTMSSRWIGAIADVPGLGGASVRSRRIGPVVVHPKDGPYGTTCTGPASSWIDLGLRGRGVQITEVAGRPFAVFIDEHGVVQVFELQGRSATRIRGIDLTAKEFVIGDGLVVFRTPEATARSGRGTDLNGDGDMRDDVLHVYDFAAGVLHNLGQAVVPCRLPACDPRVPYRVAGGKVTFLTRESDQGVDLNNDGRIGADLDGDGTLDNDLVVQLIVVPSTAASQRLAGVLGDGGEIAPPLSITAAEDPHALSNPLRADVDDGSYVFATAGRCVERFERASCLNDENCDAGSFCDLARCEPERDACWPKGPCPETADECRDGRCCRPAVCARRHGVCTDASECPIDVECRFDLVVAAVADADRDGVADVLDVCPETSDPEQKDTDGDAVGDACERAICGNGVVEPGESCDDGNRVDGDRCDPECRIACTPAPVEGCLQPTRPGGAELKIVDGATDSRDRLVWKWTLGEKTTPADFGDPGVTTDYALCVYGDAGTLAAARIPAGGTCTKRPCWKLGKKTATYKNKARTPDGVARLALKAGKAGRAKATVVARGKRLTLPPLPLVLPIRVQLQSAVRCWEASYVEATTNTRRKVTADSE